MRSRVLVQTKRKSHVQEQGSGCKSRAAAQL